MLTNNDLNESHILGSARFTQSALIRMKSVVINGYVRWLYGWQIATPDADQRSEWHPSLEEALLDLAAQHQGVEVTTNFDTTAAQTKAIEEDGQYGTAAVLKAQGRHNV